MEINDCLKYLKEGIRSELSNLKLLEGDKLDKFIEIFGIQNSHMIYYNDYNIVMTNQDLYNSLMPYLPERHKLIVLEIPQHNVNLWVYEYYNDQVLSDYLNPQTPVL